MLARDAEAVRYHLRVFGSPDLRASDGRVLDVILAGNKRLALLTYLAVAHPGGFARRDTLLALLWPDATVDKARQNLRSMLYVLRTELGEGIVLSRGADEVGVAREYLQCDVIAFDEARAGGRLEEAVALYRGDLLTGFYVDQAPEFERWLEDRRAALRRHAADTHWALADRWAARENRAAAESHARQAVALTPADEMAMRRLMTMLSSLGDSGAALDAYHAFVTMLASDYDARPSPETSALAAQIRGGDPAVVRAKTPATSHASAPRVSAEVRRSSPRSLLRTTTSRLALPELRGRRAVLSLVVAATILAIGGVFFFRPQQNSVVAAETSDRVVVLPFRVFGATDLNVLSVGLVDMMVPLLSSEGGPRAVDPRTVAATLTAPDHPSDSAVARRLGARYLMTGSVTSSNSGLTIAALVTEAATGRIIGRAHAQGGRDSIATMVEQIAARLLLDAMPAATHVSGRWKAPPPFEAVRAFLAGRAAYRRGGYENARDQYERALLLDSGFVLPAFGLAELTGYIPFDPHNAISMGKRLAWKNAHLLTDRDRAYLAAIVGPRYPSPSPPAELAEARERAVELNPERADAWFLLGEHYLHAGAFLGDSAINRAESAFRRALERDSLYAAPLESAMELAFLRGDAQLGMTLARRFIGLHPDADVTDYVHWRIALESDATAALDHERKRFTRYNRLALHRVSAAVQTPRAPIVDAELAAKALVEAAATVHERVSGYFTIRDVALIAGKPTVSTTYTRLIAQEAPSQQERLDALYGLIADADLASGEAAVADSLRRAYARTTPAELKAVDNGTRWPMRNLCFMLHWDLGHEDYDAARRDIAELRSRSRDASAARAPIDQRRARVELAESCRALGLIALARVADPNSESALRDLRVLESQSRSSPIMHGWINLWLAHQLERAGDIEAARHLVAQRLFIENSHVLPGYQTYLYDEARLAARAHDCAAARRAMHTLLTLQADAERRVRERDRALAALVGRCTQVASGGAE